MDYALKSLQMRLRILLRELDAKDAELATARGVIEAVMNEFRRRAKYHGSGEARSHNSADYDAGASTAWEMAASELMHKVFGGNIHNLPSHIALLPPTGGEA